MSVASSSPLRILVVEDDPVLGAHLFEHLGQRGAQVVLMNDGEQGLHCAWEEDFDLVLMDILMPGLSGLEVLASLRAEKRVPVVLMSALGDEENRISGFSQGADDYLPKPFSLAEMDVRIDAIFRRIAMERGESPASSHDPDLVFDEARSDICHNGQWAKLTPTEYRLMETFSQNAEEVLTKPFLYQQVLHHAYSRYDRSLDMHVSNVRRKLQAIGYIRQRVESVWGKGYLFTRPGN
ncbi:response regulator transcription factor [Stutzerimonas kirkiae]|uniref:DNA-binding response regulator n=1 Tax=Stutzerimonas kirkiae TaxID=2211392 RepID=A0A4Q9R2U4_9GAMM|nr:response regulator transcription factor [Stutzerimonas kirkiae]TBU92652.1 DNA-binding response regulator [Stutzerimonas kirkiae]TBV00844.1 DNA-binding response regulator [Stutzerimonas kirkiae]TBV08735.1 DNA-binding response regulator [Stutzerimonas kirkiae]TBV11481.1 DNA-binding response regulator [Stutzerimonas kirkiae]